MIQEELAFVRELLRAAPGDTPYGVGYVDALKEIEEHMLDTMWREGEDDVEEA